MKSRIPLALTAILATLLSCSPSRPVTEASGTIEATEVRVSSTVQGRVLSMEAVEGASLKQGDPVAKIDHEALDLQLGQAKAGVELARSQLDLLLGGARSEDLAQAQAAVDQANDNLRLAEADAKRMRELTASGSSTQRQLDDAEARLTAAKTQVQTSSQGLKKLEAFARPEELRGARARLEQADWTARIIERSIRESDVSAPVDGVVAARLAEPGELASPGTGLILLEDMNRLYLTIYLPESELGRISLGAKAEVFVDSFPGRAFSGTLSYISPRAEFTPKNVQTKDERVKQVFAVKIDLGTGEAVLKPGMPADARLAR
ncbi:MAG TPA: efflux RND transporter periplasmic adaptor subunit [Rectinemataceae bacterium]|nr:efflux RND transporter periplasmic adaptor subunit [Rectinemataceae bacterium]